MLGPSPGPVCHCSQNLLANHHQYPPTAGEPGQLGPSDQPLTLLPARGHCTAWMTDGCSLAPGCGAGLAKPGCFPGDWPFLGSDTAHWLRRLGNMPFLLPHPTAYSYPPPSCRIAILDVERSVLSTIFFLKEKMSRLPHNLSPKGEGGEGRGSSIRPFSAVTPRQAWCAVAMDTQTPGPCTVEPGDLWVHFLSSTGVEGMADAVEFTSCSAPWEPSHPPPTSPPALFLAVLKKSQRLFRSV